MSSDRFTAPPPGGTCPDLDTLADLHAEVLDEQTAAGVRAHATSCARCQETLAALDATVATLSSLPPVAIPQHVIDRIDRALAEESGRVTALPDRRQSVASTPHDSSGSHSQVTDLSAARERKRGGAGRWLLAAAAAAAVVTGGIIVINQQSETTGTGTHVAAEDDFSETAPAPGDAPSRALQGSSPGEVLQNSPITAGSADADLAGQMAEVTARNQCLAEIPDRPLAAPEAVQEGSYDGREAYGFVFPVAGSDTEIVMYVVAADDCAVVLDTVEGTR